MGDRHLSLMLWMFELLMTAPHIVQHPALMLESGNNLAAGHVYTRYTTPLTCLLYTQYTLDLRSQVNLTDQDRVCDRKIVASNCSYNIAMDFEWDENQRTRNEPRLYFQQLAD